MAEAEHSERAVELARVALTDTVAMLQLAGVQTTALAEYLPPGKRLLLLPRPATMRPVGEVWRLGSLLLGVDETLWAGGPSTRSAERGRVGYQSVSREERRDIAAAALRGGYPAGTAVNYDALPIPLDAVTVGELDPALPIGFSGGELRVRWRVGAPLSGAPTLAAYLRERAHLLIEALHS